MVFQQPANGKLVFVNYDSFPISDELSADPNASFIQQFRPGNASAYAALVEVVGPLALSLRQEQSQIVDERSAKDKRDLIELTNKAHELWKGVEFLRRVQSTHGDEQVGAIILDYRNPQKCLFDGRGKEVRSHVIQYLRANPLAQVWLAGTVKGPALAYLFDYDSHRQDLAYQDCDFRLLIDLIENSVGGQILIFGYSSALRNISSSRVITQGYSG